MPLPDDSKEFIRDRLEELGSVCLANICVLLPKARKWRITAGVLNILAAAFAAAAGATGLSSTLTKSQIGILALASAVASAVNLGLGAGKIAEGELKAAHDLEDLRVEAESWLRIELRDAELDDARKQFNSYRTRLNDALALTTASKYFAGRHDTASLKRAQSLANEQ